MKVMIRAAFAALGIASIGSAYVNEGEAGQIADTMFTEIPGVIAQAPVQSAPAATAQSGQAAQTYVTNSSRGYWFPAGSHYEGGNG